MNRNIVITGAGHDRVGIVADLSEFLFESGCNLLDSSMTLLRGSFALILMAALPESLSLDDLKVRLAELGERWNLILNVRELSDAELSEKESVHDSFIIAVYGADRAGIVAGITRHLAKLHLNITDVATKFSGAGEKSIFVMILEVHSSGHITAEQLQKELTTGSGITGLDITVQELETVEL